MGRKPLEWPTGVEPIGKTIRIRFMWKGKRRCETLAYPQTPQGVQAAAGLRTQVVQLAKLGMLSGEKYAEFFPSSSYAAAARCPLFGDYAQDWLNARDIVKGTRDNYIYTFNRYWMPALAALPIDEINSALLRKLVAKTEFPSARTKRNALIKLSSVLKAACRDELIPRNPVDSIERPKVIKKQVDPFTVEEADTIIAHLYANLGVRAQGYAPYFEFALYTGMRPAEIMALRWDELDLEARTAHVCRIVADGQVHERTKTKVNRFVLLNSRAIHAIEVARQYRTERARRKQAFPDTPYVFPPCVRGEHLANTHRADEQFKRALTLLGIRPRPQYNCRHTYATICLMAGMNPAFIAGQLGHSVQMLLSTYARWLSSSADWKELEKFEARPENGETGTKVVRLKPTAS